MGYFKPLRRKIGIVTLLLACVFMGGWVRSSFFIEGVYFPLEMKRSASLESYASSIIWMSQHGSDSGPYPEFHSRRISDIDDRVFENPLFQWRWQLCGFGFGNTVDGPKQVGNQIVIVPQITLAVIPYWSINIPLSLTSLWLLLSKPCKSIQKKINEATNAEGT